MQWDTSLSVEDWHHPCGCPADSECKPWSGCPRRSMSMAQAWVSREHHGLPAILWHLVIIATSRYLHSHVCIWWPQLRQWVTSTLGSKTVYVPQVYSILWPTNQRWGATVFTYAHSSPCHQPASVQFGSHPPILMRSFLCIKCHIRY